MLSNKDIRIEDGNIIINGDKYPIVQDVSEIETEISALTETVGDETGGLVKDVSDIAGEVDDLTEVLQYGINDLTNINASLTINEINIVVHGKVVTLGINFSVTSSIAVFAELFKLPATIKSYGTYAAIGIMTNKTLHGAIGITTAGAVLANTSLSEGAYYQGQLTFIRQ